MTGLNDDVKDLQRRLNLLNPTRLPRLAPDGHYGVRTMARVMEFQFRNRLKVDGVVGPDTLSILTHLMLAKPPKPSAPSGRCILVDLIHNKLTAFQDGTAKLQAIPIHGGSAEDPSTRGVFQMTDRRLRHHTSSQFPDPPDNMQFSLFYNKGQAIHQGPADEESHGCIHVDNPNAEKVFKFAGDHDVLVIVVKRSP